MNVIITGGAGFIGGHAVKHFQGLGDSVLNIDKLTYASKKVDLQDSNFLQLDVCETEHLIEQIKKRKPDFLIHFAAETHVDNSIANCEDFIHSNVKGVASVLNACKATGTKLCHISTDEVYGPAYDRPFNEEDALNPLNPYSSTKAAGDLLIKSYKNTYGLDYVIIRPSNNYGPNQHTEKFIPKLIDCLKKGNQFPLYGAGDQEREWTYVEDTVRLIRMLLTSRLAEWNSVYNLSSGITFTNIETAMQVLKFYNIITKNNFKIEDVVKTSKDRPGHDRKYWISADKLKSVVKFDYTGFQSGLEKTISSYV